MKIGEEKVVSIALLSCNCGFKLGFLGEIGILLMWESVNVCCCCCCSEPRAQPGLALDDMRRRCCQLGINSPSVVISLSPLAGWQRNATQRVAPYEWRSAVLCAKMTLTCYLAH